MAPPAATENTEPPVSAASDDAIFRSAFDRSSPNFHQGIPTPVPIGGKRVPEGATEFPAAGFPVGSAASPPTPAEAALLARRAAVLRVKAAMNALATQIGKPFLAGENRPPVVPGDLAFAELHAALAECGDCPAVAGAAAEFEGACAAQLPATRAEYGEFMLNAQRLMRQAFAEATRLLQEIKQLRQKETQ